MRNVGYLACLTGLVLVWACHKPSPDDDVRLARRKYEISLDFTVHSENDEVTYEVSLQNKSGGPKLQEITVIVQALDESEKVFWSELRELDVAGLANLSTKSLDFKETIPGASANLAYFNVVLAPDDEKSDFKNYKEFRRVTR